MKKLSTADKAQLTERFNNDRHNGNNFEDGVYCYLDRYEARHRDGHQRGMVDKEMSIKYLLTMWIPEEDKDLFLYHFKELLTNYENDRKKNEK